MAITFSNYFEASIATFKGCKMPKREPDYISISKWSGNISSVYWYGKDKKGDYVIRLSDHWITIKSFANSRKIIGCESIASCFWRLKAKPRTAPQNYVFAKMWGKVIYNFNSFLAGKAYLHDFIPVSRKTDRENAFRKGSNHKAE